MCVSIGTTAAAAAVVPMLMHKFFLTLDASCKKGKSVPLQAWSGPEGSRKLRFPDFMTTAQGSVTYIKVKSVPLQAWSGPEGSRKLRFPDFTTTAQGSVT